MARVNKNWKRKMDREDLQGFPHRDHRSKKNRRAYGGHDHVKDYRRRKEQLKLYE